MNTAIFGAVGTIGRSVAAELLERGHSVRAVGRSEATLQQAFGRRAEIVVADASLPGDVARAARGADAIVYSLGLPYSVKAFAAYPAMMDLAVSAARDAGVKKLLLITNVYPYGLPTLERVAETHPRNPVSAKGHLRKEQEDVLLAADGTGGLRTLSLRLPDFYGPHASLSLGNRPFESALQRKPASLLGPIDTPHEFMFTPDVGSVVCDLLERDAAFGRAYNFAGPGSITVRDFTAKVYAAAGVPLRLRVAGPTMVRLLGLVMPMMRELSEMSYLQTHPVLLDDTRLQRTVGTVRKTSYDEGIRRTLEFMAGARS